MKSVIDLDTDAADGPALPLDPYILLPQIIRCCLSEGQAADLALDPQFMNARCRAHQIVRLMEFVSTELDLKFSIRSVARPFHIDHSPIKRSLLPHYEGARGRSQHQHLSPEAERALVE
jgi:hypothetical protein